MNGNREVSYQLEWSVWREERRKGESASQPEGVSSLAIPRMARLLALAIRLDRQIREQAIRDYAEVARRGRVTRARVTQIMKLLDLAPDIQEEILFLAPGAGVNERKLRPVADTIHWDEQRRLFQKITGRPMESSSKAQRTNGA
jgi:hypothetical protein